MCQATLILLISDAPGGRASLQQLADKSDLAEADVRKRMVYWVSRRVVREVVIVEKETEKENGAELSQGAGGVGGEVEQGVAAISLGYEIIEDQAAEVAKHEATGSLSSNTEFDMTGNEVGRIRLSTHSLTRSLLDSIVVLMYCLLNIYVRCLHDVNEGYGS